MDLPCSVALAAIWSLSAGLQLMFRRPVWYSPSFFLRIAIKLLQLSSYL